MKDHAPRVICGFLLSQGSEATLYYNNEGSILLPNQDMEIKLELSPDYSSENPDGWIDSATLKPVQKDLFISVLQNVKRLLIRAVYSRNNGAVYR